MYHMSIKTISRANGSSAAAAAAYRSGKEVTNERTGEVHDYTRKQGVEHSEIVLPPGAPAWEEDRSALWSAAELAEKRKDATVAREFQVAIPKELTKEQGIELVREFTAELVDKHRFAADIAVHKDNEKKWDGSEKGYTGYHAHILCSTRRLTANGFGEKTRELDGMKTGRDHVQHWRERWEVIANKHLEIAGHDQRIDRRSLKDQGIECAPTKHLGVDATAMERRGEKTEIGDSNREIQQERKQYQKSASDRQEIAAIEKQESALKASIEAAQKEHEKLTLEAEQLKKSAQKKIAELPIDDQIAVFHADAIKREWQNEKARQFTLIVNRAKELHTRTSDVIGRQEGKLATHDKTRPIESSGLFASLKKATYDHALSTWRGVRGGLERRWTQLQDRLHLIGDYMRKAGTNEQPTRGERLAEKKATQVRPELAANFQQVIEKEKAAHIGEQGKKIEQRCTGKHQERDMKQESIEELKQRTDTNRETSDKAELAELEKAGRLAGIQTETDAEQKFEENQIGQQQASTLAKELNAGNDKGDQTKEARRLEMLERFKEKAARDRGDRDRGGR